MRSIRLEHIDSLSFWGIHEENLQLLVTHFPSMNIVVRGDTIKYSGEENDCAIFENVIDQLQTLVRKHHTIWLNRQNYGYKLL